MHARSQKLLPEPLSKRRLSFNISGDFSFLCRFGSEFPKLEMSIESMMDCRGEHLDKVRERSDDGWEQEGKENEKGKSMTGMQA